MDLVTDWNKIRKHFNKSFSSNLHVSIASINSENNPTVTPIGSMFLNDNQTGFYFEKFVSNLPINVDKNPNICVLGVNSNKLFWVRSLYKGYFTKNPAIKLYGKLGDKRLANSKELARLKRRVKLTNRLKGNTYLWKNMEYIREIKFTEVKKINLGEMTVNV